MPALFLDVVFMDNLLQFSVLGMGVAFVDTDMAEAHGYVDCDMNSDLLPPRLRRRMSSATRLALAAGERACKDANVELNSMPSVFASIVGEIKITDVLCRNIAEKNLPISPTQFHNSVHNTAAGYWSIVTKNQHASQAIGAGENTLMMGMLECHCQLQISADKVLLICYEESAPEPLVMGEQISDCAVAFLLGRATEGQDLVSIYQDESEQGNRGQDDDGGDSSSWSAVAKALAFAKLIRNQNSEDVFPVSTVADGWFAKVEHGA